MDNSGIDPGIQVRLIANPAQVGVTTGRTRELNGETYVQVQFPGRSQYLRPDSLELLEEDESPWDLALSGKFGRADDLRRCMTHLRLSGRLANLLYSMEATNTDFYPHQYTPVLRFLDSPARGILIADEVGLGKTIEAGLIWTELRSREDAKKLLVICPAMLREKWRRELLHRFGVNASILNAADLRTELEDVRAGRKHEFAAICSMQGLRPRRGWANPEGDSTQASVLARFLDEIDDLEPIFDLVIVDEAHYMRNPETLTNQLGRLVRNVSSHVVMLSATPIHLGSQDLFHLLAMLDEDTFQDERIFDSVLKANRPLIELRDRLKVAAVPQDEVLSALRRAESYSYMGKRRQLRNLIENPPDDADLQDRDFRLALADQLDRANPVSNVVSRTRKRDVVEWRVIREPHPEKVEMSGLEEAFYERVTERILELAEQYESGKGFLLVTPQRQMSSSIPAAYRAWTGSRGSDEEDAYNMGFEEEDAERFDDRPVVSAVREAVRQFNYEALVKADSKRQRLIDLLVGLFKSNPNGKVVLFSYFKETLKYLHEQLNEVGISSSLLMGGAGMDKDAVIDGFRAPTGAQVLLASEVASEGVDLQFARLLINYDLPWNPMRIEQRIGRIDRLGQEATSIHIWNLLYKDTIDERIYDRLLHRIDIFRSALGDLEDILGEQLRSLTLDLLLRPLTRDQQEQRIEQTENAISERRRREQELETEAVGLMAHGDYILNTVRAARDLQRWNSADDLWVYVRDFFQAAYPGCEFLQLEAASKVFRIRLSEAARGEFEYFLRKHKWIGQTRLARPEPEGVVCRFDPRVAGGTSREEVINQFHPLIRFVAAQISEDTELAPHPVTAVQVGRHDVGMETAGEFAYAVFQWSASGVRAMERLAFFVEPLGSGASIVGDEAERMVVGAARHGSDAPFMANEVDFQAYQSAIENAISAGQHGFDEFADRTENENQDRIDTQVALLKRSFERRQRSLLAKIMRGEQANRKGLVMADRKRLSILTEQVSQREQYLKNQSDPQPQSRDVSFGVIRVL